MHETLSFITRTVCACLTTPGNFISEMRYSGCLSGGSTNSVNSGLIIEKNIQMLRLLAFNMIKSGRKRRMGESYFFELEVVLFLQEHGQRIGDNVLLPKCINLQIFNTLDDCNKFFFFFLIKETVTLSVLFSVQNYSI